MDKGVDFVLNSIIETKALNQAFRKSVKEAKEKEEDSNDR